jgi:glucose-1-phosphate thymidylyltransferase
VVTMDDGGHPPAIEETPVNPRSRIAVTGLYMYAAECSIWLRGASFGARRTQNHRREPTLTDTGSAACTQSGCGVAWLDGGTPEDLNEAGQFVRVIQDRTGLLLRVTCPEEIAYRRGFIDRATFARPVELVPASNYRTYLRRVLDDQFLAAHWTKRRARQQLGCRRSATSNQPA